MSKNDPVKGRRPSSLLLRVLSQVLISVSIGLYGCSDGDSSKVGGSNDPGAKKVIASIVVQPADNKLAVGKTQQFTATGIYTDGTTATDPGSEVIWSSSSPSVATITPDGMVSAVAAGNTTITAAIGDISGTAFLTVPETTLVALTVTPANPTIAINTTQQFTATGAYSDGTFRVLTSEVIWSTSDPSRAGIDSVGKATAAAGGSATITAKFGNTSASASLGVTPASLISISVTPSNPTIAAGTSQQFSATGTFSDNSTQDLTASVVWSSSAGAIASVGQDGKALALADGQSTITAASNNSAASTTLNVTPAVVIAINVTPTDSTVYAGMTQQFVATGTLSDNTLQDLTKQVTWSSSANSVARIGQDGRAAAVGVGTAAITASFGGITGSQNLNVTQLPASGVWEGTYTIYDAVNTNEIGTYTFKLVLVQNGTSVTGTTSLRYNTTGQIEADGELVEGRVTGRQIDFVFTYIDSRSSKKMVNIGTALISDTAMTGDVIENYNGGYNCSYIFNLKKL